MLDGIGECRGDLGQRLRAGWLGIVLTEIVFVPIVDTELSDTASLIK